MIDEVLKICEQVFEGDEYIKSFCKILNFKKWPRIPSKSDKALDMTWEQLLTKYFRKPLEIIFKERKKNLMLHQGKNISVTLLIQSFTTMAMVLMKKYDQVIADISFNEFWYLAFNTLGYGFSSKNVVYGSLDIAFLVVEIGLIEPPCNVFAEGLGRLTGLFKTKTRNKTQSSLLDCSLNTYKNTPHLRNLEPAVLEINQIFRTKVWKEAIPTWEKAQKRKIENCFDTDHTAKKIKWGEKLDKKDKEKKRKWAKHESKIQIFGTPPKWRGKRKNTSSNTNKKKKQKT